MRLEGFFHFRTDSAGAGVQALGPPGWGKRCPSIRGARVPRKPRMRRWASLSPASRLAFVVLADAPNTQFGFGPPQALAAFEQSGGTVAATALHDVCSVGRGCGLLGPGRCFGLRPATAVGHQCRDQVHIVVASRRFGGRRRCAGFATFWRFFTRFGTRHDRSGLGRWTGRRLRNQGGFEGVGGDFDTRFQYRGQGTCIALGGDGRGTGGGIGNGGCQLRCWRSFGWRGGLLFRIGSRRQGRYGGCAGSGRNRVSACLVRATE